MKRLLLILSLAFCVIANAQYTKLIDFDGMVNGSLPNSPLIFDGTFLYGMTNQGGTKDVGTIFKIKPDGTGYSKLFDFDSIVKGSYPQGSLISEGTFLYGMTSGGGTNDKGTIFKIMPNGTGYVKLLDFDGTSNGSSPQGSLIYDGTFLYGMTSQGGTNDMGTIFKIMPNGTGYSKLLDFDIVKGRYPLGSLIFEGTFLYGMTSSGGTNDFYGTIFRINPDGTGYFKLLDFDGINGDAPQGSLISDGIFLYGMTAWGGTNGAGNLFKIMLDGAGYSILFDFEEVVSGYYSVGSLFSDGIFLYGTTKVGGINYMGTIFKYGIVTSINNNNLDEDITVIYPNPNNGVFTIQSSNHSTSLIGKNVEIVNVLGEKVYLSSINSNKSKIDLCNQAKGIYFVKIYDGQKVLIKKMVIE